MIFEFCYFSLQLQFYWLFSHGSVDSENESEEVKPAKGTIDFKEVKRVDRILASLQRKVTQISIYWYCMSFIFSTTENHVVFVYLLQRANLLSVQI